jgi:hypothetical protein
MPDATELSRLLVAIATGNHAAVTATLAAAPAMATARLARSDEFFIDACSAQVYEGDTALHAAAFAYDADVARDLMALGADVRARNRRGAEPLHAATMGGPGSTNWNPARQCSIIRYLVDAGADPTATNDHGSTPADLARLTTGRGGVGSEAAKVEQRIIIDLLV